MSDDLMRRPVVSSVTTGPARRPRPTRPRRSGTVKRLLLLPVVIALGVVGVGALADATQNRPDQRADPDSASAVTFAVDTRGYPASRDAGQALWIACQGTFRNETLDLVEVSDGTYRATVRPALGEHAERRLTGCLDDATIDRLNGHVVSIAPVTPSAPR